MSVTRESDVDAQIPDIWAADLYAEAEKLTFWHRFEGPEGSNMPVIRRDDLEKNPGDNVYLDIVLALTGAGLTGDTDQGLLDGNEEKLKFRQTSFSTDALRHGVRWTKLGKIRINHRMRGTALNQLKKWLAGRLDNRIFAEFTGTTIDGYAGSTTVPDSAKIAVGSDGDADAADDIAAGEDLHLDFISELKAKAKVDNKIEPIRMENGEELYFFVMHDYAALPLKKSSDWKQAQREARERGADNPLFTGALGVWDNVVLLQSDRIPRAANAGSVQVAHNLFLGAQGLVRGYAYYPDWTEQYFSYGEEQGIGTFVVVGQKLVTFDLTAAGGAADADKTAIGSMVVYSEAPAPGFAA
jgi:N4-gp56 family major capsid protein